MILAHALFLKKNGPDSNQYFLYSSLDYKKGFHFAFKTGREERRGWENKKVVCLVCDISTQSEREPKRCFP